MKCFMCRKSFSSLKQLILHFKYLHGFVSGKVSCVEPGCFRIFTSLKSFKKHAKVEHKENISRCDNANRFIQENNSISIQDTCQNMLLDDVRIAPEPGADIPNADVYLTEFRHNIISFVSSLYDNISVPRNQVQEIINYVSLIFKSKLFSVMRKVMPDTVKHNTKLNNFLNSCFKVLDKPFEKLETEYKRLQLFQSMGHYIEPTEIILDETLKLQTINNSPVAKVQKDKCAYVKLSHALIFFFFELPCLQGYHALCQSTGFGNRYN